MKNKFTDRALPNQGLKQEVTQFYQSETESRTKTKDCLITPLSNSSVGSNTKLMFWLLLLIESSLH